MTDFFSKTENWKKNFCLNCDDDLSLVYIRGFKKLTDLGLQNMLEFDVFEYEMVYSTIFSYRHYIELSLKKIVVEGSKLLGNFDKPMFGHRLNELWIKTRQIICKTGIIEKEDSLLVVDDSIAILTALDPEGISFRYASTKKGLPTFPRGWKIVNLEEFRRKADQLSEVLESIICGYYQVLCFNVEDLS